MTLIMRGWVGRLYPNRKTAERLHQWAGAQRFLGNRLLDAELNTRRPNNIISVSLRSRGSPAAADRV